LEYLRVDISKFIPPVFEVGKVVTDCADALFDGALIFGNLVETIQGMVVELSTGIAMMIQRLALVFCGLEAIPVVVVYGL
jgi:hypothetical protein